MESNLATVRQRLVYTYLPYLTVGLGVYYSLITVAHSVVMDAQAKPPMVSLAASSAVVLFGLALWLKNFPPPVFWAHPLETLIGEIVLLNCLGHLYFVGDLRQTSNVAMAIIGGGVMFLSAKWLAFFITTCAGGWALVIGIAFRGEDWTHYAFMLFTATVIAILTHAIRVAGIRELEGTRMVIHEMELRKKAEQERSRLEAELRHAEKLRSLGVLAAGVAHDFNNLLVGMLGNAELARAELDSHSPVQPYLSEISSAARCASDLTQQMLNYSGKGRFIVDAVDLRQVVEEIARLIRASVPRNVHLEYLLPRDLPPIEADAAQARHLIMNLAINAAEAIGAHPGTIVVSAGVETLDAPPPGTEHWFGDSPKADYVFLRVSDSGPGIDDETRERMFEPFFSTKFTGRGLGLAAALGIARGHKGGIRVETGPQQGTAFTVWFPRSEKTPARRSEPDAAAGSVRGGGVVLVADDEPSVRLLIQRVLEIQGFSVVTAEDGAQALAVFDEQGSRLALTVLDLTMPRASGQEVMERLRLLRADMPLVLTSGYNQEDLSKRWGGQRPVFLQKPFTPAELLAAVGLALGRREASAAGSG